MAVVSGDKIGEEIVKIFGLKNVVSLDFHFAVNMIASVDVKFYPEEDELKEIISLLKNYELEKTGEDAYKRLQPLLQSFCLAEKKKKEENNMLIFGEKGNEV